jgi:YesN/AraC family two-component response regulator
VELSQQGLSDRVGTLFLGMRKNYCMKLLIKNMVSSRCILAVKHLMGELNIPYTEVKLGEIEITSTVSVHKQEQLKQGLVSIGLELITDKKSMLIEKIKNSIMELVHYSDEPVTKKYSCFLSEKLKYDYTYLSNLFKKSKGICIEDYIIAHKIERVKQLLVYSNMNLTEISYYLNYSSVGHLSNQFKKVTGITTRDFKQLENKKFIPLEVL